MIMQNEYYTTQIFVFFSLVPILNKLPDHHNLPLFDDIFERFQDFAVGEIRTRNLIIRKPTL